MPKASKLLTADDIFAAADIQDEQVEIPEWGGHVLIRPLSKGQHSTALKRAEKKGQVDNTLLEDCFIEYALVNPKLSKDEISKLRQKNAGLVERILRAIMKASNLTPEEAADAERAFRDE